MRLDRFIGVIVILALPVILAAAPEPPVDPKAPAKGKSDTIPTSAETLAQEFEKAPDAAKAKYIKQDGTSPFLMILATAESVKGNDVSLQTGSKIAVVLRSKKPIHRGEGQKLVMGAGRVISAEGKTVFIACEQVVFIQELKLEVQPNPFLPQNTDPFLPKKPE